MRIAMREVRNVITPSNLPDADFVINPYVGCQHACVYCYADFMRRFTGHGGDTWGEFVDVKSNAPETIREGYDFDGKTILLGSVTDPYQPVEATYRVTRRILEKLLPSQPNIEILTKSALVRRDIDLLQKFRNLRVGISMTSLDSEITRELEPYAATPQARIRTLEALHQAGIQTYLFVSPIFPGITDFEELVEATRSFVDEYLFENLNIRANNRAQVTRFVSTHVPELLDLYANLGKEKEYWDELEAKIRRFCEDNDIPFRIYFNHKKEKKK